MKTMAAVNDNDDGDDEDDDNDDADDDDDTHRKQTDVHESSDVSFPKCWVQIEAFVKYDEVLHGGRCSVDGGRC